MRGPHKKLLKVNSAKNLSIKLSLHSEYSKRHLMHNALHASAVNATTIFLSIRLSTCHSQICIKYTFHQLVASHNIVVSL